MRLREEAVGGLINSLNQLATDATQYLFGSRVDDTKRGGDIDLLVVSDKLNRRHLRKLRLDFFKYFGEQKLDIILDDGQFKNIFNKMVYEKAILL
jgi:predicted nucleotidyltransferase